MSFMARGWGYCFIHFAKRLKHARFPEDFMFQLSTQEAAALSRSQTVTLKRGQNIKYLPFAFTEQGIAMLSGVLHSETAINNLKKYLKQYEIY